MTIEFLNVSYRYNTVVRTDRLALDDISFHIAQNESVGIIGPTGSGKTTLLQMFTGLLSPVQGVVLVDGNNIHHKGFDIDHLRRQIGIVFQFPENQLFEETVFHDVAFAPKNAGVTEPELTQRVLDSLKWVGLEDEAILQVSPHSLSEGQKRKVAIAGVLSMQPDVLIMDEPTACLDAAGTLAIEQMLGELKSAQKTIVVVSHNVDFIAANCDRILVLADGKIQFDGEKQLLFNRPELFEKLSLSFPRAYRLAKKLKAMGYIEMDNHYSYRELIKCITE